MPTQITSQQWAQYERDGYLKLGQLLNAADLRALQQRKRHPGYIWR